MAAVIETHSLGFLVIVLALAVSVRGNSEGDALYALRRSLSDPDNVLQSWDPNLVNPCTWFHVTCNGDNHVTRVYVSKFPLFFYFFIFLITAFGCAII